MNYIDAINCACEQPTLAKALTWIAIWESERIVKQARANPEWETCFEFLFKGVLAKWQETTQ